MDGKSLRRNIRDKRWGGFWLKNLGEFLIKVGQEDQTSPGR